METFKIQVDAADFGFKALRGWHGVRAMRWPWPRIFSFFITQFEDVHPFGFAALLFRRMYSLSLARMIDTRCGLWGSIGHSISLCFMKKQLCSAFPLCLYCQSMRTCSKLFVAEEAVDAPQMDCAVYAVSYLRFQRDQNRAGSGSRSKPRKPRSLNPFPFPTGRFWDFWIFAFT